MKTKLMLLSLVLASFAMSASLSQPEKNTLAMALITSLLVQLVVFLQFIQANMRVSSVKSHLILLFH